MRHTSQAFGTLAAREYRAIFTAPSGINNIARTARTLELSFGRAKGKVKPKEWESAFVGARNLDLGEFIELVGGSGREANEPLLAFLSGTRGTRRISASDCAVIPAFFIPVYYSLEILVGERLRAVLMASFV